MVSKSPEVELDRSLVRAIEQLMRDAGEIALTSFREPIAVENKSTRGFDPVTPVDRGVERHLRAGISRIRPNDRVNGEEDGASGESSTTGWVWTIDPIDGTRSYVTGSPLWGVLVGLQVDGVAAAGWCYQPHTGELFSAAGGVGRLVHNGSSRTLTSSSTHDLARASLYCTDPAFFFEPRDRDAFERLARKVRIRRFGGDCYSYAQLALGTVDLVLDGSLQPYDILPLIPIIESAGGVVTTFEGLPADAGGSVVAAANEKIHDAALNALGRQTA
ncbi:inositol monophosphatase family protein [Cumulibacter manganitolerans]|uniref:inositol monophosphatase family protein n=1 Tax=Cumulibacter manganitolerans TaxID=1884992 RepID=UPI001297AB45|nr:inositol monophosphatase family protein [Cumulibacter manganitolerans]